MPSLYKIHPAIGVARVGSNGGGFFLQGEAAGAPPFDLDANGRDSAFAGYKDANQRIRRQAARFRVFEYDVDAAGVEQLRREIAPDVARIEWTVRLAASKAAGRQMTVVAGQGLGGEDVVWPGQGQRNSIPAGHTAGDLKASATLTVTGANAGPVTQPTAIMGRPVTIGEARTDASGRLIALGGLGEADSWANPAPAIMSYLNNPTWFDDVADGPVDAKLFFLDGNGNETPGDPGVQVERGAWLLVGPPDFAPDLSPAVSLHDIALDAWRRRHNLPLHAITFPDDVLPFLERTANLYWTNVRGEFVQLRNSLAQGGLDNPSAAAQAARRLAVARAVAGLKGLHCHPTPLQRDILAQYTSGNFAQAADPSRAMNAAETLDHAALFRCIGGGFYPGIEAGFSTTLLSIWSEPGRFTRGAFTDHDGQQRTLEPGFFGQRMACPWQADFKDCEDNWWPAQRPDVARFDDQGTASQPPLEWARGVVNESDEDPVQRLNMVRHFARLGVIRAGQVGGNSVQQETERDQTLPA